MEVAEAHLKDLRDLVDADRTSDPEMTKFVDNAVGWKDDARVRITIEGQWVTYSVMDADEYA